MKSHRSERMAQSSRPHWQPIPAWFWMLLAAIAVVITALVVTDWLLIIASHARPGTERAQADLDAVRTGLAAGAGAGAAVGLMLAFRRQYHQETATLLTDLDATERRITELYTKAVEQLGNDKAPVRLGGLYALERLAQDNPAQRPTIVKVICAYLRMPFPPKAPTSTPAVANRENAAEPGAGANVAVTESDGAWQQERQVRLAAQQILCDHLSKTIAAHQSASVSPHFWSGVSLDLSGVTLIDFILTGRVVRYARFDGATFNGEARFERTIFDGAPRFNEATFNGRADFSHSTFKGAPEFNGATFEGDAKFGSVTFNGGTRFEKATFNGKAQFNNATVNKVAGFNGYASFDEATFSREASFSEAAFNQSAGFDQATFKEGSSFWHATIRSVARFFSVTFGGAANFDGATFDGNAWFDKATFNGYTNFRSTTFSSSPGNTSFKNALVRSPDDRHVWPTGWHLDNDGKGTLTIVRSN